VTGKSKARPVSDGDLEKIRDAHVRMSLALQEAFGLRREEAIKFSPLIRTISILANFPAGVSGAGQRAASNHETIIEGS
jgi:hypothetical protein